MNMLELIQMTNIQAAIGWLNRKSSRTFKKRKNIFKNYNKLYLKKWYTITSQ